MRWSQFFVKKEIVKKKHVIKIKIMMIEDVNYTHTRRFFDKQKCNYNDFLKWWFSRPQSKHFMLDHNTGGCCIPRDSVICFNIKREIDDE